jgi:hypothetical protein
MNRPALAKAIRLRAHALRNADKVPPTVGELAGDSKLLLVLARILSNESVRQAFGAPGDWGYNTPIGSALADIPEAKTAGDSIRVEGIVS